MDARIRTGAAAYDQPAGAGYCPPGGSAAAPRAGATGTGTTGTGPAGSGTSGPRTTPTGAAPGSGGTTASAYSASFGDVGMGDAGDADRARGSSNGHGGHHPADAFKRRRRTARRVEGVRVLLRRRQARLLQGHRPQHRHLRGARHRRPDRRLGDHHDRRGASAGGIGLGDRQAIQSRPALGSARWSWACWCSAASPAASSSS